MASEFRTIALYNTTYKIISKIVINTMKPLLYKIISPNQSTFVINRHIGDNMGVIYELIHKINHLIKKVKVG